jgi:hypothetical protein
MEDAILLTEPAELLETGKLERALALFGVTTRRMTLAEFLASGDVSDDASKFRLFSKGSTFVTLLGALGDNRQSPGFLQKNVHSAFVYAGGDTSALERVASTIVGRNCSFDGTSPMAEWQVTNGFPEFCKSMSGVRVRVTSNVSEKGLGLSEAEPNVVSLISSGRHSSFVKFTYQNVPIFVSTAATLVDVHDRLAGPDFDIRQCFLSATPLVLYIRWAFANSCWQPPETPACLVIDDPLLKPRYGFLKFQQLLDLMRRHNFSTSIAFIPWNWRRNNAKTVQLFKENPERFSLSIHGCDHTGGEFGSIRAGRLAWKSGEALARMSRHHSRTGLLHDAVMVFPQGVFSSQSMKVLKRSQFIGTVNSEVFSTDPAPPAITIADYWQTAVLNYSDFPIFTRRYASAGIENFAFDILLGKPCLVVAHHNDCFDDCRHIGGFMQQLNQLKVSFRWTGLAEVVRRSFRQRESSPGVVEIEMYGSEVRIENPSGQRKLFRFRKRESEAGLIKDVRAAGQTIQWEFTEGGQGLAFQVELNPGENKVVTVTFRDFIAADGFDGESVRYKLKVMLRRYLSEARDNYLRRKSFSN